MHAYPPIALWWRRASAGRLAAAGIILTGMAAAPLPVMAQAADLSVVKTAEEHPVTGGTEAVYTVVVTNHGPGSAAGVTVTDTLPGESHFTSVVSDPPGMCTETSGVVICSLGDMAVDEVSTVTVSAIVVGAGPVTNTAAVRSQEGCDPDPHNNFSKVTVTATGGSSHDPGGEEGADLEITKSGFPDPVVAGQALTYTIDVDNRGPADASEVIVADTLPTGAEFVSALPSSGECELISGVLVCNLGPIPDDGSEAIVVTIKPPFAGSIVNNVSVRNGPSEISNPRDNSASEFTTVTGQPTCTCCDQDIADLDITKTASPNPATQFEPLTFTINVVNNGPATATNVVITDPIPAGVIFDTAMVSQGTVSVVGNVVTAEVGTLAVNQSVTLTFTVIPQEQGTIINTATAVADQADPTKASVRLGVLCQPGPGLADLIITKSAQPNPVTVGDNVTFTITVLNDGPSSATNVVVTDPLPAGVTYVSSASSQGTTGIAGNTVTANLGTLEPGESATVTIVVTTLQAGTLTNTATATSDQTDPTPASASVKVIVNPMEPVATLALTKTASPDPVFVGDPLTYVLTVTNNGPDTATDVTITDPLPSNTDFVSAATTQGTVFHTAGLVTAQIGTLLSGQSATVTIIVTPNNQGITENTATATANEAEPVTASATVAVIGRVIPNQADLAISKSALPTTVKVGQPISYVIGVANLGPDTATDVVVTDQLPPDAIVLVTTSSVGTITRTDHTVTFNLGSIPADGGASIGIVVFSRDDGVLTNTVTVAGSGPDPNPANNTATAVVEVLPLVADLSLTKTATPDPARINQPLVYTLVVRNNGPDSAPGTMVIDDLPPELSLTSASTSKGTVSNVGNKVVARVGMLLPGESAVITIQTVPTTTGIISNIAVATSVRSDPVMANNEVAVVGQALPGDADLGVVKLANPTSVGAGDLVTYTITVSNSGPMVATGVRYTDMLPANSEFVASYTTAGIAKWVEADNTIQGFIPTIGVGESVTATIIIRATGPAGVITNNVVVTGEQPDSVPANNTASVSVTVLDDCCPDLAATFNMGVMIMPQNGINVVEAWLDVCNIGNDCGLALPTVNVDFYLSDNDKLEPGIDEFLQCIVIQMPPAGQCEQVDLHVELPASTQLQGRFIIAVLNPTQPVTECRLNNNYIPIRIE